LLLGITVAQRDARKMPTQVKVIASFACRLNTQMDCDLRGNDNALVALVDFQLLDNSKHMFYYLNQRIRTHEL
jgi:hypothetical protein